MIANDVFISHSVKDKAVADAVCARLEAANIPCWIAPRDVSPGTDWTASIVDAITQCRVFVLIFSNNANRSADVQRELRLAVAEPMPIIPMRIEGVAPSKSMHYLLGTQHWLDALTQPLDEHLDRLVDTVRDLLRQQGASKEQSLESETDEDQVVTEKEHRSLPPTLTSAVASIAVLPFTNLSADPEHQFVADGIATELHSTLSKVHRLRVAARSSSFGTPRTVRHVKEIANKVKVRFVISGNVQFSNDRIRVNVALDNVVDGVQIWSEAYDREMNDLFSLQREIAHAVTSEFGGARLRDEIAGATERPTEDLDAWSLVQRARRYILGFTPSAVTDAETLLRQAIALDPEYAAAHATLASVLGERVLNGLSADMKSDRKEAIESANSAFAHSPADPFVLKMCGSVWAYFGKSDNSLSALRRAVRLAPFDFGAWGYLGWPLVETGVDADLEELHQIIERILEATPHHPGVSYWLYHRSVAFASQHDHERARDFARESVEHNPMFPWGWMNYANTLGMTNSDEQARQAMGKCMEISPPLTPEHYGLMVRAMSVNDEVAEARLAGLRKSKILT
jgi:TolB-like protein